MSLRTLLLVAVLSAVALISDAGMSSDTNNSTDFIRTSCGATLYPDLCYSSLAGYANTVQTSPAELARAAVSVALFCSRHTSGLVSSLLRSHNAAAAPAALRDCASVLSDAVYQMRKSLMELSQASGSGNDEEFRFAMGNVETWMSAALTDDDTCTDGIAEAGAAAAGSSDVSEIFRRMADVKKVTSNALALVNKLVASGRSR